jgi:predicted enzyme related to lactoylglutathione lyase
MGFAPECRRHTVAIRGKGEFVSATTKIDGIAWDELHTRDRDKAEAFYNTLFGWTSTPVEMSPEYTYHLLNRADNGEMFAGSHQQGPDETDQPSFWLVSLGTDDVDKATAKASELGATVVMEPMDIPGTGRFSLFIDPQGAAVAALAYADGGSAPDRGEGPGCIVWHELVSSDPEASANFYSSIFGFEAVAQDMGELKATVFKQGDEMFANILPKPSPEAPDAWVFYVEVRDAQETTDLAKKSGGAVIVPPMPLPPIGTVGWLADPTGAVFGILQPADPAQ